MAEKYVADTPGTPVVPGPARKLVAVTPNDSADLPDGTCRSLYIGGTGSVEVIAADDTEAVILVNAPAGPLPVAAKRVRAAGTTATDIVALY